MAESGITKKVLAYALKDLMAQRPLAKITVGDICDACDMNRKSFYYHFRDKYDLVNWIFYTEFFDDYQQETEANPSDALHKICQFFEKNMDFYRAALKQTGQISFYEYLGDVIRPIMAGRLKPFFAHDPYRDFYTDLFVNVYRDAIVRWVNGGCKIPSDTFVQLLYRASNVLGKITPPSGER